MYILISTGNYNIHSILINFFVLAAILWFTNIYFRAIGFKPDLIQYCPALGFSYVYNMWIMMIMIMSRKCN